MSKDNIEILKKIEQGLKNLLFVDSARLRYRIRKVKQCIYEDQSVEKMIEKLQLQYEYALERKTKRESAGLSISYPKNLTITEKVDEIKKVISENQVVIVSGTTGSGKTTQLPKILIELGYGNKGRIGCTQPRRLAASGMARRVASEMYAVYGKEVGCQVRFANDTCDQTVIKFMTDGILLAETMNDKLLLQYDALIIDEAHERSLNIDFILGYLKNILSKRPDLKIIISSATLDSAGFSEFYGNKYKTDGKDNITGNISIDQNLERYAPIVKIEGRTFPVEDYYLPPVDDEEDLSNHILRAVKWLSELDKKGDVLVFLPGEREITDALDLLFGQNWLDSDILPLFGRLSMAEQQRVFNSGNRRRIILATNVAETSITIPGIHYVIDSGLVRLSRYNPRTHIQSLLIEQISQASAKQRRGRCGRIAEGLCVYLYDKDTLNDAPQYTDPEICRTSLAGVILQMEMLKLPTIDLFPFIDPPNSSLIREGYKTLFEISALDKNFKLTNEGFDISAFPIDPHLAKMICQANRENIIPEMLALVSFFSIQDPRERPTLNRQAADLSHKQWYDERSDFVSVLKLWNFIQNEKKNGSSNSRIRRLCKQNFINFRRFKEWQNLYQDLFDTVQNLKWNFEGKKNDIRVFEDIVIRPVHKSEGFGESYESLHRTILSGLPRNIGLKGEDSDKSVIETDKNSKNKGLIKKFDSIEPNIYIGTKNRKFNIFPGSNLFKVMPKWIMSFALVETSKLYARINAEINPEWLEEIAPDLCKYSYKNIAWNQAKGFVYAIETVSFAGLLVHRGRRMHYCRVDAIKTRDIFIRDGIVPGNINTWGKWRQIHRRMLYNIRNLESRIRRPDSLLDEEAIFDHFNKILPDTVLSTRDLEQWLKKSHAGIAMHMNDAMLQQLNPIKKDDYPDKIFFYDNPFKLKYIFDPGTEDDGLTLYCSTDQLGFLPDWATDWLIPGWLSEKVRLLIRSLPKRIRVLCNPAQHTSDEFVEKVKTDEISIDQFLLAVLADYLSDKTGERIFVDDFDSERLPKYLIMKVAETDSDGKIIGVTDGIPDREEISSKLSSAVVTIKKWIKTGCTDWPYSESLPEEVSLKESNSTLTGYPALVDEEHSVGVQVFMNETEAEFNHRSGLIRLFKIQYKEQGKHIEKKLPINSSTLMTLSFIDPSGEFKKDFVDTAIYLALTNENTISIRDANTFNNRAEETLGELYSIAVKMGKTLDTIVEERDAAMKIVNSLKSSKNAIQDIEEQLGFLFRPGFMKNEILYERYFRFMKALRIRADRLRYSPLKDNSKLQELYPYQTKLDERLNPIANPDSAYGLMGFAWCLQDYRISLFAPELRPFQKVSPKRLDEAWENTLYDRLKNS